MYKTPAKFIAALLSFCLISSPPALALPEMVLGTGSEVSPADAISYYRAQGLASPAWSRDLDIDHLAQALGNDPDRIYAYVHDEIELIPIFGVKAGARGAYIDKAGTPFDQSQLLVELFRSAGISASYQLGTITLTGSQFSGWFGVTNAAAARKLLADGGYPAVVTGTSTISSVTMMHLWVRATINGATYVFDPAFKTHTVTNAMDVGAAMGLNATTFFTGATTGATTATDNATPRVSALSRTSVRTNLNTYATTLLNYIKTNLPNGSIENVIGGSAIDPNSGAPVRQSTLAYQTSLDEVFAGDIPLCLRTQVSLILPGRAFAWGLDDIYGLQLALLPARENPQPPAVSQYYLTLGGRDISGMLPGAIGGATVTINNPYAARSSATASSGSYLDRTVTLAGEPLGAMQIFVAAGRPSSDLAAWQERTQGQAESFTVFNFTTQASDQQQISAISQQIATRRRIGVSFMTQLTEMTNLLGGVSNSRILVHDIIGTVTSTFISSPVGNGGPAATSFVLSMEPAVSAIANNGDASQSVALSRAVATLTSALEGCTVQAAGSAIYPVSTIAQLDWANAGPPAGNRWYYFANTANWAWVKSQILLDYAGISPVRDLAEQYINAGYTVLIPKSSNLGPAPDAFVRTGGINVGYTVVHPDRAGAFIAINPTTGAIAHISGRPKAMAKGGGGSNDAETNPGRVFAIAEDFLDKQFTSRGAAGNVDLKTGILTYSPPADLVVGTGAYPYSLSFQRSYRSGVHDSDADVTEMADTGATGVAKGSNGVARDKLFGTSGWTSNLHHYASVSSSGEQIFGRDDPRAAVQSLVVAKVLSELLTSGASNLEALERQIIGAHVAMWWTEGVQSNTITINQGHASRSFVKLHDGTFVARGSQETVQLLGTRTPFISTEGPTYWWNKLCVKVTGAQREVSYYGIWDTTFANCVGLSQALPSNQGEMQFSRKTFPYGVTVNWDSATKTLSNSLGRRIQMGISSVTDPDTLRSVTFQQSAATEVVRSLPDITDLAGNTWRYRTDGGAFEAFAPSNPATPMLRYVYEQGTSGAVSESVDALGHVTRYAIGGGHIASTTDALGNVSRVYHDRFGQIVRSINPLGFESRRSYDNHRRLVLALSPEGKGESYEYDVRHNRIKTTVIPKPGAATPSIITQATYDTLCNVPLTETDAMGRVTTTTINQTTCLATSIKAPALGASVPTTSFVYNTFGRVTQKTDPTGLVTQMTYDTAGNLTSVIVDPGTGHIASTTTFAYDPAGNVKSLTDPRGNIHTATYDALRRLTSYSGPVGTSVATSWTYDVDGLITQIAGATGNSASPWATTRYTYYDTGRVQTMTDADGNLTRYTYDDNNRLSVTTDPELKRTQNIYDAAGQIVEVRRAVGTPLEQAYSQHAFSPNGKELWVRDAKGNQTTYTLDRFDRLYRTTFPNNTFEELSYDLKGNITGKLTRGGQLIQNTYDTHDRVATHLVPQPSPAPAILTTYTYDLADRTTAISDNTGHSLTYGFDTAKRIVSATQAAPNFTGTRVVSYVLDKAGNKTRATWADGYYVDYAFDALNRVTTAREKGTFLLATYLYDPLSRRTSLVYGNGASQTFSYSMAGDLLNHTHAMTGTTATYTNTYTRAHQLASEAVSNAAWQYVPTVFQTTTYSAANNLNQYVNVTVGANPTVTLGYDANGNLTGDGVWTFAYDAENRLKSANKSGAANTYAYDTLGRRQAKVASGVTTTFLSDGDEEIAEYSGANAVLRRYVPGPATDQPIAMVTPSGTSNTHLYFHTNRQGSTVAMSNDAGTMSEGPYTYDAFGVGAPVTGVPFKYTGRRLDPETGLYYYRARYYSPTLGRFLQTDPVGYADQMNLYGYVGDDPVNATDPSGQQAVEAEPVRAEPASEEEARAEGRSRFQVRAPGRTAAEDARQAETETIFRNLGGQSIGEGEVSPIEVAQIADSQGICVTGEPGEIQTRGLPREGIYEFPDARNDGLPYIGQSGSIARRLNEHESNGRLVPGTESTTEVLGGRTNREIAEHQRVRQVTNGVPASQSSDVSNRRDPIGPKRQHLLEKPR